MTNAFHAGVNDGAAMPYLVAALYRFARVEDPQAWRSDLESVARKAGVRGTLLIASEGINGTMAGPDAGIAAVLDAIRDQPGFAELELKFARAEVMPFYRLKVRIKAEIVTLGRPDVDPIGQVGTYVEARDWNALIADPGTLVIDTRNDYEGQIGAFAGAVQPDTATFRDFPAWFETEGRRLIAERQPERVAMYCTGGIRCEKATALLKAEGVQDVRHLHGGILRYLEDIPAEDSLWKGECFVFDERVAVGHGLSEGTHTLCRACRRPVSAAGRASSRYVEGVQCDACADDRDEARRASAQERQRQMQLAEQQGIAHIGQDADARMRHRET